MRLARDTFDRVLRLSLVGILAMALAACGGGGSKSSHAASTPAVSQKGGEEPQGPPLGFPVVATKNTTRVAGADPVADAAAIALAVYPARTPETRPAAVVLADVRDWRTGMVASVLAGQPVRAPILFTDGDKIPAATSAALDALQPTGSKEAGGAQVIRVGTTVDVQGYKTTDVAPAAPPALAAAVDRLHTAAAGSPPGAVVIASSDRPEYAMPAAGWAAKSGDPILWVTRDAMPHETTTAIKAARRPSLYVLGPADSVSDAVLDKLGKLGPVKRITGTDPVTTAIEFARYRDGAFGWYIQDPGHGLNFASTRRPQDAAAAAPLSANGTYGPLLVLTDPGVLPAPLQDYLLDIQPGYDPDPVRGVYSHGWMVGDESAISAGGAARIDTLLEIQPVDTKGQ